jgi:hypothetical protein
MNGKIENSVPLSPQRIVIGAGLRVQIYIRSGEAHGTRALCEIVGPVTISCVELESPE